MEDGENIFFWFL